MKSFKIFIICKYRPAHHLKAEKIGFFLAIWNFITWSYFFFSTGTRKGKNMVKGPANLRKFHRRKRDESHLKDSYFLCLKTLRNGMKLRQDRYLSLRRLSNLSPFGNLSHGVSFSVDLIFRRTRSMNITGAVTGNPRFHHIKKCIVLNCF